MEEINYTVDQRKYAIRFLFENQFEARNFKLPNEYRKDFELTKNIDKDRSKYIRVAQIKMR